MGDGAGQGPVSCRVGGGLACPRSQGPRASERKGGLARLRVHDDRPSGRTTSTLGRDASGGRWVGLIARYHHQCTGVVVVGRCRDEIDEKGWRRQIASDLRESAEVERLQMFRARLASRRGCLSAGQPSACGCEWRDGRFGLGWHLVWFGLVWSGGVFAGWIGLDRAVPCRSTGGRGDTVTEARRVDQEGCSIEAEASGRMFERQCCVCIGKVRIRAGNRPRVKLSVDLKVSESKRAREGEGAPLSG